MARCTSTWTALDCSGDVICTFTVVVRPEAVVVVTVGGGQHTSQDDRLRTMITFTYRTPSSCMGGAHRGFGVTGGAQFGSCLGGATSSSSAISSAESITAGPHVSEVEDVDSQAMTCP